MGRDVEGEYDDEEYEAGNMHYPHAFSYEEVPEEYRHTAGLTSEGVWRYEETPQVFRDRRK